METKQGRGRPIVHLSVEERKAANAESARLYRAKKRALKVARKNPEIQLTSSIIDLSTTVSAAVSSLR
jgi:hypothetical protein